MNARERWLIGLMVGVVAYGGYTLISRAVRVERTAETGPENLVAQSDAHVFADQARQRMNKARLSPDAQHMLDRAAAPWPESPFSPKADRVQTVVAAPQTVIYGGYCHVGDIRLAILNGREYRVREVVAGSDLVVESIEADHVVLTSKGGGRRVSVALNESAKHEVKP